MEVSEVLDCGQYQRHAALHRRRRSTRELDELHALGVRSLFPVHKFDNALGGTAFDDGATGLLVNIGNKYATGEWWDAEPCDAGPRPTTRPPTCPASTQRRSSTLLGQGIAQPLLGGDLPAYPPAPLCNPKGLTAAGRAPHRRDDATAG